MAAQKLETLSMQLSDGLGGMARDLAGAVSSQRTAEDCGAFVEAALVKVDKARAAGDSDPDQMDLLNEVLQGIAGLAAGAHLRQRQIVTQVAALGQPPAARAAEGASPDAKAPGSASDGDSGAAAAQDGGV